MDGAATAASGGSMDGNPSVRNLAMSDYEVRRDLLRFLSFTRANEIKCRHDIFF